MWMLLEIQIEFIVGGSNVHVPIGEFTEAYIMQLKKISSKRHFFENIFAVANYTTLSPKNVVYHDSSETGLRNPR